MSDFITDEFPEFSILRAEANRADRERVIEAVMLRIQPVTARHDAHALLSAIGTTAWPVIGMAGIAAMVLLFLASWPEPAPSATAPTPSTAQALGMPTGVVRWTEERERTPQLLEVVLDLPTRTP